MARILEDGIFPGYDKNMSLEGKVAIITGAAGSLREETMMIWRKNYQHGISDRYCGTSAACSVRSG